MRGLPIGYSESWDRLRYETRNGFGKRPGESSAILIAPARSGKGTDILVPTLLDWEGSCIVLDPKGQLASITARHRRNRLRQNVVILNPFNVWPDYIGALPHSGFNPLVSLDPKSEAFGVDCDSLAEGIVVEKPGERESHFPDSAQQAVSGVIMAVARSAPPEKRNLASVYEIVSGKRFFDFARDAAKTNRLIEGRLGRFAEEGASGNRELVSIVSSAITNCKFMGNDAILRSLAGPAKGQAPLRWRDLRKRPTTVYLILPVRYLNTSKHWFRLVLASALNDLLVEDRRGMPVLMMMDEFAQLGRLPAIENSMALSAGMGLTMLPVLQDAGQLKDLYGERMQSFLSIAGCQMFFAPRDLFTAELISNLSGQKEVLAQSRSITNDRHTGEPQVTDSATQQPQKLLLPDQVMALGREDMLMRVENVPDMIRAKRRPYYADSHYRRLCAPDPYHDNGKRGGLMKSVFGW
jgi:type IV secretion system protein VirD4